MSNPKAIPDEKEIAEASELEVFDAKGAKVKFGSLFEKDKTIIVFIRHFFCSICQTYVENLVKVSKESLDAAGTRIVIVGCGEWKPIEAYHATTGFQGQIYADPTRNLYHALGMNIETLAGSSKPSYSAHMSMLSKVALSMWRIPMKHPSLIGKQGPMAQLGGDFVFGPGTSCTFASRMQNTEDHVPVLELMKSAGVEYSE